MNRPIRRVLRATTLSATLTATVALAAPAAYPDEPTITAATDLAPTTTAAIDLADDAVALTLATVDAAASGCLPYVRTWSLIWDDTPNQLHTTNGSVYYQEVGGATAHLSCPGAVRITAWILDEAPDPWRTYRSTNRVEFESGSNPSAVASQHVPYKGPDAPVLRPAGQITVHVEVHRRLSTGRYEPAPNGCVEYFLVAQPEADLWTSVPPGSESCTTAAKNAVYDTTDNIVVN